MMAAWVSHIGLISPLGAHTMIVPRKQDVHLWQRTIITECPRTATHTGKWRMPKQCD